MFCRNCGKQLGEGALFCDGCGAQQPAAVAPVSATAKRSKAPIIAAAVVALLLMGAVGAWALFARPLSAEDYEEQVSQSLGDVMEIPEAVYYAMEDAGNTNGDEEIGDDNVAAFRDTMKTSTSAITSAKADIEGLVPPKEYKEEHEDLLASLDDLAGSAEVLSEMATSIEPEDTANDIQDEFEDLFHQNVDSGTRALRDMRRVLEKLDLEDLIPTVFDNWGLSTFNERLL